MPADVLPAPAARVFLSAADTWYPPGETTAAASDLDLMTELPSQLAPGEARRLALELQLLEWMPRLRLQLRGFCWLARGERRAFLERLEGSSLGPLRRRVARLHRLVDACYAAAAQT